MERRRQERLPIRDAPLPALPLSSSHEWQRSNILSTHHKVRRVVGIAIEFQAQIKDGIIEIPEAYRHQITDTVRVIILTNVRPPTTGLLAQLLEQPIHDPDFVPMARDDIYADRVK